ncbi:hypothetical protein BDV59DRAFT_166327 [Aspergillus ambiguus]|uniref:uncharacterized protein n=1 Tax=Aspergillus ambiguus TaxID=176160 RepID=UPI003CCCE176
MFSRWPLFISRQTAIMIFPGLFSLVVDTILAPFMRPTSCTAGLNYCGFNLLRIGNYAARINTTLREQNMALDRWSMQETLFYCDGRRKGSISFAAICEIECRDGGTGHSDWCLGSTLEIAQDLQLDFGPTFG